MIPNSATSPWTCWPDGKAEFVQAAAGGAAGPVFATRYLTTRSAPTQLAYLNSARRVQALPSDVLQREFRRHASTIGKENASKPVLHLPPEVVEQIRAKIAAAKAKQQAHQQDLQAGAAYKRMRLVVERVKCIDDSDEWGDDEINIGGQYIAPSGSVVHVDQFVVFTDADARSPSRRGSSLIGHWRPLTFGPRCTPRSW